MLEAVHTCACMSASLLFYEVEKAGSNKFEFTFEEEKEGKKNGQMQICFWGEGRLGNAEQ